MISYQAFVIDFEDEGENKITIGRDDNNELEFFVSWNDCDQQTFSRKEMQEIINTMQKALKLKPLR